MVDVNQYEGLVIARAKKFHRRLVNAGVEDLGLDDLIQEGWLGLLEASSRFDPSRGAKLGTFAVPRIDGAIIELLRKRDPLTQRERATVKKLEEARNKLTQQKTMKPTLLEMAQELNVSLEEVERREALKIVVLSIDELIHPDSDKDPSTMSRQFSSSQPIADDELTAEQLAQDVENCMNSQLDLQERIVLMLRHFGGFTLADVGKELKTSKDSVDRWQKKAQQKLKKCLESKGWSVFDVLSLIDQETIPNLQLDEGEI